VVVSFFDDVEEEEEEEDLRVETEAERVAEAERGREVGCDDLFEVVEDREEGREEVIVLLTLGLVGPTDDERLRDEEEEEEEAEEADDETVDEDETEGEQVAGRDRDAAVGEVSVEVRGDC
jgi:hypothetical protein